MFSITKNNTDSSLADSPQTIPVKTNKNTHGKHCEWHIVAVTVFSLNGNVTIQVLLFRCSLIFHLLITAAKVTWYTQAHTHHSSQWNHTDNRQNSYCAQQLYQINTDFIGSINQQQHKNISCLRFFTVSSKSKFFLIHAELQKSY